MATPTSLYPNLSPSIIASPEDFCTLSTCPLSLAHTQYLPSLAGNALYVGLFGLFLIGQLFLGVRHRTWGFLVGMLGGIALEIVGYVARIQMHSNPFKKNPFMMYIVTITIAPAFLSASIYLTLARIIPIYSTSLSRFKPRTYTILFVTCDFIALVLQAAGGAIASLAKDDKTDKMGINIMIAGVSWQVFSLGLFAILCAEFAWRVKRVKTEENLSPRFEFVALRRTRRFRLFLYALGLATSAIFVRSVFRCAELRGGFKGKLAQQQVTYMILEGGMIVIAVGLLTVWHPGWVFKGAWQDAGWSLRGKDLKMGEGELVDGGAESRNWLADNGEEKFVLSKR